MKFYKRDPDRALAGMNELTLRQRGAYNSILDLLYSRDGDVPDDDARVAKMICCHWREWKAVKEELIALGKIWLEGGKIRAKRVQETLKEAADFSQEQRKKAAGRWQKAEKPNENKEPEMPPGNALTPTATPTPTDTEVRIGNAREASERLERQLREAAGWESEPAPNLCVTGPVEAAIQAGAILETDVLPVIRALAPKARARASWKFFIPAIIAARDDRLATLTAVSPPHVTGTRANGTTQTQPSLSPRQAHLAKLKQRAIDAKLREIGEGGDSGGPDIPGPPGDADGKPGLPGRPH